MFNLVLQYGFLTSQSLPPMLLGWSQDAHEVLEHLNGLFKVASVLVQSNPNMQFIVKGDASDADVRV